MHGTEEAVLAAEGRVARTVGSEEQTIACPDEAAPADPRRAEKLRCLSVVRQALAACPGDARAWDSLGHVHVALGEHAAALEAFAQASALEPGNLPFVLHRTEAAVKCGQGAALKEILATDLAADPLAIGPLIGLGLLSIRERRINDAIDFLEAAFTFDRNNSEPPMLLGIAYSLALQPERAAPLLRLALDRDPENDRVANDLAVTLSRLYRYEEAVELLSASIEKNGPNVLSLSNLATAKAAMGEMQEASTAARSAMLLAPQDMRAARALCNLLPYQNGITAADLLKALKHAASVMRLPAKLPLDVSCEPERPLRIGLLSNLLRTHPVGWLTLAGLEALDRDAFSVHCFGRFDGADAFANRFSGFAAAWHRIEAMDDFSAAQCIRDAGIDILIELGGFGDTGRIDVCAHRPAPLQVKWVGMQYHSTGLDFVDYFLTDGQETPPGYEAFYAEKLLRLPDGYVCYLPPAYAPEVAPLPALRNGYITFGCLNNLMKFSAGTLKAWVEILWTVPDSRLILRCPQFSEPGSRKHVEKFFAENGIAPGRVQFFGRAQHREFLGTYNEIDIALDPFPYSGGLSTCEALYMGVPVLTLAGEIFAARHSVSHLSNVRLRKWIAFDGEDYIEKAKAYSCDVLGLAKLRAGLRQRVMCSPLCDAPRFGRNLGVALRNIWREHCRVQNLQ